MKHYIRQLIKELENLKNKQNVTAEDISNLDRHIAYCCHERLIHLLVTLGFAIMTMIALAVMMIACTGAVLVLFVLFAVMTGAYIKHYWFLENSIQKLYLIADELRKKDKIL